ncbi:DNA-binding protein inhibitor ID-4-like [Liolophura sinensis]|uniref:DNA-binding protein inhibitor ID-4-like n=1 Tax=Liolophura sinensis TaxID=3198878 RepID=UPI0031589AB2
MKAATQAMAAASRNDFALKQDSSYRISKPRTEDLTTEMQACFHKLKDMVPTVPSNRKLSKVQLLQHVIDYILDLEVALDVEPGSCVAPSPLLVPFLNSVNRTPLAEKSEPNFRVSNERVNSPHFGLSRQKLRRNRTPRPSELQFNEGSRN